MTEDQYTNQSFMLPVGDGHEIWVHDWGNKYAETVFFQLHGGPGSNSKDRNKLAFSPETQRVIFHDQRGSGQSTPTGERQHNTTQDLSEDINHIANKLDIKSFVVVGNSWGSTLALYYAINNPERVQALVIGGIWTSTKAENKYLNDGQWRDHFPDLWDWYVSTVPKEHRHDPSAYHFNNALSDNPEASAESVRIFGDMEAGLISLNDRHAPTPSQDYDPAQSLIEMQYMANGCYMPDNYILDNSSKLTMPVHILQGRYDFVCPPEFAYKLHRVLPNSTITWLMTGHAGEHETITAQKLVYQQLTRH